MGSSDAGAVVVPFGVTLSAIVVVIFLITGWLGGELVFRHRIGMIDDKSEGLSSADGTSVERIPITGIDLSHAGGRKSTAATSGDRSKPPM
jgi:hypothetical protein